MSVTFEPCIVKRLAALCVALLATSSLGACAWLPWNPWRAPTIHGTWEIHHSTLFGAPLISVMDFDRQMVSHYVSGKPVVMVPLEAATTVGHYYSDFGFGRSEFQIKSKQGQWQFCSIKDASDCLPMQPATPH